MFTCQRMLGALAAVCALFATPMDADACSCLPPSVEQSYESHSDVFAAHVLWSVDVGQSKWYIGRVRFVAKGCMKKGDWVYIRTASSGAACGLFLQTGKTWLLNGNRDESVTWAVPVVNVHSCAYNKSVSNLSAADRTWLLGRYNCCGEDCGCVDGTQPVSCLKDPCEMGSCPVGECTANYCGGCNAEYSDNMGYALCTPCETDADCAFSQFCSAEGQCLAGCQENKDCAAGYWCSPTQDGNSKECKAYQQEGQWCGGFTPVWAQSKCAPGLVCTDVPPFIADAPGKCRKPCEADNDCGGAQYCASGGFCRDVGACWQSKDCNLAGNDFAEIDCLGYGVCGDDKTCTWECGEPPEETSFFTSCGYPVCSRNDKPPAGTPLCKFGEFDGESCDQPGYTCDAGLGCGQVLVCAASDPKLEGCPKSQRATKTDIEYLKDSDKGLIHRQVMALKLATWRYKSAQDGAGKRMGFIIEDVGEHPVVRDGKRVDLYQYASMAMAALQVQQQQIDALKGEVASLKAQMKRAPACAADQN